GELPEFGASGELNLEGRALAQGRLNPNAAAVHLDDLFGDGKSKARAALGLGVGAVDLMKRLEDAGLGLFGNAGSWISHADVEVAVYGLSGDTHLARIGELDRVAYEVEKDLSEALLVAEPDGQRLGHLGLERELLVLCQRLGGRAHRLDH